MGKRIVSIECGLTTTKIVEVSYDKKNNDVTIHTAKSMPTPEGAVGVSGIFDVETLAYSIKKVLSDSGIKTKNVVFTINSESIHARHMIIPYQKSTSDILEVVRAKAEDENIFPVDLEGYVLSFTKLGEIEETLDDSIEENEEEKSDVDNLDGKEIKKKKKKTKKKKTKLSLMAFIAPEGLVKSYLEVGRIAKLNVLSIEYVGNSVYNFVKIDNPDGNYIIVQLTDINSILTTVKEGVAISQRSTEYSYNSFANHLIERSKLFDNVKTIDEAFNYMNKMNFLSMTEEDIDNLDMSPIDQDDYERVREETIDSFFSLFNQINSFIGQYRNKYKQNIDKIIYISDRKSFPDIVESIQVNTSIKTYNFGVKSERFKDMDLTPIVSCLGAYINPVHFNILDSEFERRKQLTNRVILYSILTSITACVGIGVWSLLNYSSLSMKNMKLQSDIANATRAQQVFNDYQSSLTALTSITDFDNSCRTILNDLPDILEDIERVVPINVEIQSVGISKESIILTVSGSDKDSVAYLVENLEKVDWFQKYDDEGNQIGFGVDISSVTDDYAEGSNGTRNVNAVVSCYFKSDEDSDELGDASESISDSPTGMSEEELNNAVPPQDLSEGGEY